MAAVDSVVLEVPDPAATEALTAALGVAGLVRARASDEPTTGFAREVAERMGSR